jgi:predicted PurR-regulated permease PerM
MESWRGRGRQAGRDALARLVTAWKAGMGPGNRPDGRNGHGGTNELSEAKESRAADEASDAGIVRADGGSHAIMTDDKAAAGGAGAGTGAYDSRVAGDRGGNGAAQEDRIARGTGVEDQIERGADAREQNRLNAPEPGRAGSPQAGVTVPDRQAGAPERSRVPSWLQTGAAWSWRLMLLALAIYLIARMLGVLYIVVVPCVAALLLTALLQPLTTRLRSAGLPGLAATWVTLLIAAAVLGGLGLLVANRVSADYPSLVTEVKHTVTQIESFLAGPPLHVKSSSVQKALNDIPGYLSKHKSLVEGTVVTGGKIASEFFGGLVLMLFVAFFLIKDGERIWNWLLGAMRTETARRMDRAGHAAWLAVVYYMRGTVAVAAIHAVVIGVVLGIMGVPLALPLAVLVFVAAFVPLIGLLVAGALAILVTLAANGWVDAVILLGILIVEDQLEAHLLQPQVVGRVIRLHPLAVILSLAVGAVLAGIPGAVVAVPIVAVITRAVPELRRREPGDLGPDDP